jgi:hypothetical protein
VPALRDAFRARRVHSTTIVLDPDVREVIPCRWAGRIGGTLATYTYLLDKSIVPYLGRKRLRDINR